MVTSAIEPLVDRDVRELPLYRLVEAAHYLNLPRSTVRSWVLGYPYATRRGRKYFNPLVVPASRSPVSLSFINLVELHVLAAIRRQYHVSLGKVRKALDYVTRAFPSDHPLADYQFETGGMELFIERYGQLMGISLQGQLALKEILRAALRRVERDQLGIPLRLYPFTSPKSRGELGVIVLDPYIAFGQAVITGTGIRTATIAERYKAGESIAELADDYGLEPSQIEEAIRCELRLRAA